MRAHIQAAFPSSYHDETWQIWTSAVSQEGNCRAKKSLSLIKRQLPVAKYCSWQSLHTWRGKNLNFNNQKHSICLQTSSYCSVVMEECQFKMLSLQKVEWCECNVPLSLKYLGTFCSILMCIIKQTTRLNMKKTTYKTMQMSNYTATCEPRSRAALLCFANST